MKRLLLPFVALACLVSCSSDVEEIANVKSGIDVRTSITQESITRTSLYPTVARVNAIVLNGDGEIVTQTTTDATTDEIALDLDAGDYTLLLMANAGKAPTVNDDGTVTYTKVGDAFSAWKSVTVAKDKRTSVSAELTRCVAKLTFKSYDDVPSTVTKVNLKVDNVSDTYSIENQKGTNTSYYESTNIAIASLKADNKLSASVFCLLPAESITDADLTLTFLDADGNTVKTRTYEDVPLTVNRNTILSALMFSDKGSDATISLNTTWGEDIEVER